VYQEGGAAALEAHAPAPLQWERVQQLAGPGTTGLPIGYQPPPPATIKQERAQQQRLMGAQQQVAEGQQLASICENVAE